MENKQYYCAIDLGTTNTAIAYGIINPRNGRLEAKTISLKMTSSEGGIVKSNIVPSCVLIDINDNGEIKPTVGPYAKQMSNISPEKVVISTKSSMGTDKIYEIEGKKLTPIDISSYIIDFALNNAKEYFKFRPDDVIITVPASFDSEMRSATIEAAKKSGIKVKEENGEDRNILLDEPRAALYNFLDSLEKNQFPDSLIDINTPKNILVYDLGGGTLDVSLHKVWRDENYDVKFEDYAISLHTLVGGDNFDDLFGEYLYKKIEKKLGNINEFEKKRVLSKLRKIAEQAKIDISTKNFDNEIMGFNDEVEVEIVQANIFDNIAIDELITEDEYREIVSPIMGDEYTIESVKKLENGEIRDSKNIIFPILDVLCKAYEKEGMEVKVDAILLNGGMTKLPIIKKRLDDFFDKTVPIISLEDPELSVALGGVYYHYKLHNGLKPKNILNDTIGIETMGGYVYHIAKAGVPLPYVSKVYDGFSVSEDGATLIDFPFYLGSRNDTLSPNRKIANRSIRFSKYLKKNDKVSIQIEVNTAGIVITNIWINDDIFNKQRMEVDTSKREFDIVNIDKSNINKKYFNQEEKHYIDTNDNIATISYIKEIKKLCEIYSKSNNDVIKKNNINKIKNYEKKIIGCSNKNDMSVKIIDELKMANGYSLFKQRLMFVLGELSKTIGLTNKMISYINYEINILNYKGCILSNEKTFYRFLAESIGKSGSAKGEQILIDLLNTNLGKENKFAEFIVFSLGKVGNSLETFKIIASYLNKRSNNIDLGVLWALGKIGSREKENALPIENIEKIINEIIKAAQNKAYALSPYNAVYALAEICDRRNRSNCISEAKGKEIIEKIEKIHIDGNFVQKDSLNKIKDIAKNLICGSELSQEQSKILLEIRSKVSA